MKTIRQSVLKGARPKLDVDEDRGECMLFGSKAERLVQMCWKKYSTERPDAKRILGELS
eukprot:CAMPEP_0170197212 /NCGR_PEP_ID=MMETSP0040_2-20121228/65842_1 /TAXON_ID=641309 /ORGANISM="Lotharella oceanica, Strain CCMP622" /LENGTH=58 /DNA_ID=CAMNT_0010446837 /DNA_START=35 /DNA_END=207 /DNA_ORIENTATION=-